MAGDAIACLGCQLVLAPACTLRSFFYLLDRYPSLQCVNAFAPSHLSQVRRSPARGCTFPGIEALQLCRVIEMTGYPGKPCVRFFINLEGVGQDGCLPIETAGIEQLLDVPLRLGRLKHTVFGDRVDTLVFDTAFNLFELIDGICWELSFHNLPDRCRFGEKR